TLQNSPSFHFLRITHAAETMMNQSYPSDKSACNSPHPSSYSMILMPLEDLLVNHSYEISLAQQTHPSTMANQTTITTVQAILHFCFTRTRRFQVDAQFFIDFVMEKKIRSGYGSYRRITNLKPGEEQEDPERRLKREHCKQVITLGLMFTDKSPLKQTKLQRRFMT
ncbi:hypothetical protein HID58_085169, partial [Brassica napus]